MSANIPDCKRVVADLSLEAHPEGGFFRETYRSDVSISVQGFVGNRSVSTAIYYLLRGCDISAFHRIRSDEVWHFYCGQPLVIHILHSNSLSNKEQPQYSEIVMGAAVDGNGLPCYQAVVRAGDYFAARLQNYNPDDEINYSLVGCTVAPGFDFQDFEMPARQQLLDEFPQQAGIIRQLTRP